MYEFDWDFAPFVCMWLGVPVMFRFNRKVRRDSIMTRRDANNTRQRTDKTKYKIKLRNRKFRGGGWGEGKITITSATDQHNTRKDKPD